VSDVLILVDENDAVIGHADKEICHDGDGILHRAFSVFLFDSAGRMLIQRRAPGKRLWPGFWSNACCSHPRQGEALVEAAQRRLREELGLSRTVPLTHLFHFTYQARFGEAGSEHELCHVFIGSAEPAEITADPEEVDGTHWHPLAALDDALESEPDRFTPWFKMEWARIRRMGIELGPDNQSEKAL